MDGRVLLSGYALNLYFPSGQHQFDCFLHQLIFWYLSPSICTFVHMIPKLKFICLSPFWSLTWPIFSWLLRTTVWMMSSRVSDLHTGFQTFETYLIKLISVRYLVYNNSLKTFRDNAFLQAMPSVPKVFLLAMSTKNFSKSSESILPWFLYSVTSDPEMKAQTIVFWIWD